MRVILGCIADDFTGATDLASMLVNQGMDTVQTIGIPDAALNLGDAGGTPPLALALKSGNFGEVDFFRKAFEVLP